MNSNRNTHRSLSGCPVAASKRESRPKSSCKSETSISSIFFVTELLRGYLDKESDSSCSKHSFPFGSSPTPDTKSPHIDKPPSRVSTPELSQSYDPYESSSSSAASSPAGPPPPPQQQQQQQQQYTPQRPSYEEIAYRYPAYDQRMYGHEYEQQHAAVEQAQRPAEQLPIRSEGLYPSQGVKEDEYPR